MSILLSSFVLVLTIILVYEFVRWSVLCLFDVFYNNISIKEKPIKKNSIEFYMEQKTPSGWKGFKWLHKIF